MSSAPKPSAPEGSETFSPRILTGRILTAIDAAISDERQAKALKDLVKQDLRELQAGAIPFVGIAESFIGFRPGSFVEDAAGAHVTFYGPQPCRGNAPGAGCGRQVVRASITQGGAVYDFPEGPIYPNTEWRLHNCTGANTDLRRDAARGRTLGG